MSLELVVVCTGNRARSPLAVGVLRELLLEQPVRISSVGTLRLGALPALPEAVDAAARLGVDLSAHRSRWIGEGSLADADLVLGFERAHVAAAVVDHGARPERAFTLPELVELLRAVEPAADAASAVEAVRATIAEAAELRGRSPLRVAEIADPLGRTASVFEATATSIHELCVELVQRLFEPDRGRRSGLGSAA